MLKVGFSGAHSTGKTTLINQLRGYLESQFGRDVGLITEVARDLIYRSGDDAFLHRKNSSKERQFWIQIQQIILESEVTHRTNKSILLTDRTVVDNLAYTRHNFPPERRDVPMDPFLDEQATSWMRTYDLVFYLPVEFPLDIDTVREDDTAFQLDIDTTIRRLLLSYNIPFVTLTGAPDRRMYNAAGLIMGLLRGKESR